MKIIFRLFILMLLLTGAFATSCSDSESTVIPSHIHIYNGGYFIKNAMGWQEFKPTPSGGQWIQYTQNNQDDNYYYISNDECSLAIPCGFNGNILVQNDGSWSNLYQQHAQYSFCPGSPDKIYAYENGYFTYNNDDEWMMFENPSNPSYEENHEYIKLTLFHSDDDFYYLKDEEIDQTYAVPKNVHNSIYYLSSDNSYKPYRNCLAIYDVSNPLANNGLTTATSDSPNLYTENNTTDEINQQTARRNIILPQSGDTIYLNKFGDSYIGVFTCKYSMDTMRDVYYFFNSLWTVGFPITFLYTGEDESNIYLQEHKLSYELHNYVPTYYWTPAENGAEIVFSKSDGTLTAYLYMQNKTLYFDNQVKEEVAHKIKAHYDKLAQIAEGTYVGNITYSENTNVNTQDISSSTNKRSICKYCGGTGKCSSCNSTGGHWKDVGYYTGKSDYKFIKCGSCNGTGTCFNCHGTGRQNY